MEDSEITLNNVWSKYSRSFSKITPSFSRELLQYSALNSKGCVLDAGCGVGKLSPYLLKNKTVNSICGIDSNKEMVNVAKKSLKSLNLEIPISFRRENLETLLDSTFKNKFDSIVCLNVLYTLDDPIKNLKDIYSKLNLGGKLILSSPTKKLDIKILEKITKLEFDKNKDFEIVKKCNYFLSGQNFNPKLFESTEILEILEQIGYTIEESLNYHHINQNFTVIASKN